MYVADGGAFGVVFLVQGLRKCGFLELGNWGFFERERRNCMAGAGIVRGAMAGPVGQQASSCVVAVRPSGQLGRFFLSRVSRVCLRRSARINVASSPFQSGTSLGLTIRPPALELGSVEKRAVDGVRMMGGGPRTFPGGVTKWQWKRMQEKKAKQEEKARLAREKQLYNERRREEMMTASPFLEKPWQRAIPGSISPFPPMSADSRVRALADRFQKNRSEDLWTEEDGAVASSPKDPRPTARFLARASIHSNAFVKRSEQQPSLKYAKSSGRIPVKLLLQYVQRCLSWRKPQHIPSIEASL